MSLLINGMEMPKSCSACWALDDYGDYPRCRITEEQRGYNFPIREKRMDNCPLFPVPPHGRLIDETNILKVFSEEVWGFNTDFAKGMQSVLTEIRGATTIIPAEEET